MQFRENCVKSFLGTNLPELIERKIERSSAKRGEDYVNKFYPVETALVTWNTFVHPWQVSYKWSSTAYPSSNGITARKFLNFFHPSPIFVHFEGKFWMEIRNFSRQFDWNRFLEYDKQNIANGGGPGWKLNRCPRFLVNPENSSEPRHAILELPFTAKSLSSPRVLVRIIQMDRDISLFPRDFLGSPPPLFF